MNNTLTTSNKTQIVGKATLIKLAVDVHARRYSVCRQIDNTRIQPPQRMGPQQFLEWVEKQKSLAERVVVCYESGPFGFVLARAVQALGLECIVMAAQQLDERRKRVATDDLDAQQIASRLDRYLAGNTKALAVVKIPTLEQEWQRSEGRQREQLLKSRKQLEAQGRSLLVLNGYVQAPSKWWRSGCWEGGQKSWPAPVLEMLRRWRQVLLGLEQQLQDLTHKIQESVQRYQPKSLPQLPIGYGALSWSLLCREVLDWYRFSNRGQVGSFTGLVASEASSGSDRRQGHITKVGNARMRRWILELIWRLLIFQPEYRLVKKWKPLLSQPSRSLRKKAAVAMARECGVDLWRLATGQTTPQALGLKVASAKV